MKVLVTGGSGFVGSHVVDKLLILGDEVSVFDLVAPQQNEVAWYSDLTRALSEAKPEAVIHLAAVADVNEVVRNLAYASDVNIRLTAELLAKCQVNGVKQFVFASTTWVYQSCKDHVVAEYVSIPVPDHYYALTKLAGEALCAEYRNSNMGVVVLRYGIPYGQRARDNLVVPLFVSKAMAGEPLTVSGSGEQFRQFVEVRDLAEGTVLAARSETNYQLMNLDGQERITINRLAAEVQRHFPEVEIVHTPARPGDFEGKVVTSDLAKSLLGWIPRTSFRQGLEEYIAWRLMVEDQSAVGSHLQR